MFFLALRRFVAVNGLVMNRKLMGKFFGVVVLGGFVGVLVFALTREPKRPQTERMKMAGAQHAVRQERIQKEKDAALVRMLMSEDLVNRRFDFATVIEASSGKRVIALDESDAVHGLVIGAIDGALGELTADHSEPGSPVRQHARINEVSRVFEDGLLVKLDAHPDLACGVPQTRSGKEVRVGYPDLRVEHEPSGAVFYLDPKLVRNDLWDGYFRSFYFEPKEDDLKVEDDAVHLVVGIGHDGDTGAWQFGEWKIVDLSACRLRLKPEFQASNRELYPADARGEDEGD